MDVQILISGLTLLVASFFLKKDAKKFVVYGIRVGGVLLIAVGICEVFA
jgi:hypothetical protein